MKCAYVRSNLDKFLNSSLGPDVDEQIRQHLDHCQSCSSALSADARIDRAFANDSGSLSADFTERVVSQFPVRANSAILFRYLCGLFAASSFVGVSVYAFVRNYLHPQALIYPDAPDNGNGLAGLMSLLSSIVSTPTFHYALLALLATILSITLIIVVDLPRRREFSPVKDSE